MKRPNIASNGFLFRQRSNNIFWVSRYLTRWDKQKRVDPIFPKPYHSCCVGSTTKRAFKYFYLKIWHSSDKYKLTSVVEWSKNNWFSYSLRVKEKGWSYFWITISKLFCCINHKKSLKVLFFSKSDIKYKLWQVVERDNWFSYSLCHLCESVATCDKILERGLGLLRGEAGQLVSVTRCEGGGGHHPALMVHTAPELGEVILGQTVPENHGHLFPISTKTYEMRTRNSDVFKICKTYGQR